MTSPAQHSPEAQAEAFREWEAAKAAVKAARDASCQAQERLKLAEHGLAWSIFPGLGEEDDYPVGTFVAPIDGRFVVVAKCPTFGELDVEVAEAADKITADVRQPEGAS